MRCFVVTLAMTLLALAMAQGNDMDEQVGLFYFRSLLLVGSSLVFCKPVMSWLIVCRQGNVDASPEEDRFFRVVWCRLSQTAVYRYGDAASTRLEGTAIAMV